jgi:hypothetical protein
MPDERTSDLDPAANETADSPDTEGHILAQALAASQIVGQRGKGSRPHANGDDDLKPLTRPFPSMREDRTRK